MQERASGVGLGWDLSCFVDEDCVGRGVIDLGVAFPLDLPLGLDPLPFPFLPLDASYSSISH